jgi:hypothetical protein
MGSVEGMFIATDEEVQNALGKQVYFGEILGKHSEISGELEEDDLEVVSEDQDFINKVEAILGTTLSGYNPLDYLPEEDEEEDQ